MIIEIALGIVLGFVLLSYLDVILSLGLIVIGFAIALVAIYFLIYGVTAAFSNLTEILTGIAALAVSFYCFIFTLGTLGIVTEIIFAIEGKKINQIIIERPLIKHITKNHNEIVGFLFDKCGYGTWLIVILILSTGIFIALTDSLYATATLVILVLVAINLYRTHLTNKQRSFAWLIGFLIAKIKN